MAEPLIDIKFHGSMMLGIFDELRRCMPNVFDIRPAYINTDESFRILDLAQIRAIEICLAEAGSRDSRFSQIGECQIGPMQSYL